MMDRKLERKAKVTYTGLHDQFRLGLVYDTNYLIKSLELMVAVERQA